MQMIGKTHRYTGTAAERVDAAFVAELAARILDGYDAEYAEIDTGKNYFYTEAGWVEDTSTSALTAIKTALEALDNAVSGSEFQVDVVAPAQIGVAANDAVIVPADSLAQTLAYNSDGTLNYIEVTYGDTTYRQTMTYTDGDLTGISAWEAQA